MALNFYFLKNTEIFKFKFLENLSMKLSKIFRDDRRTYHLSILHFFRKSLFKKNIRVKFGKIWLGGPPSQGVPKFYERVGVFHRGPRDLSNGEKNLALRLSYFEFNWILIKFLNSNFSKTGRWDFPKFSGIVEGLSVYRFCIFFENRSSRKISGKFFLKLG